MTEKPKVLTFDNFYAHLEMEVWCKYDGLEGYRLMSRGPIPYEANPEVYWDRSWEPPWELDGSELDYEGEGEWTLRVYVHEPPDDE